ncbi:hypothetical protein I3843_08G060200 [Carya illinoinensis]|nr:hypothetical protein I3843_08G060200 [Carya illinoinensis]
MQSMREEIKTLANFLSFRPFPAPFRSSPNMIPTRSTHLSQPISPPLPLAVPISPRPPSHAVFSLSGRFYTHALITDKRGQEQALVPMQPAYLDCTTNEFKDFCTDEIHKLKQRVKR